MEKMTENEVETGTIPLVLSVRRRLVTAIPEQGHKHNTLAPIRWGRHMKSGGGALSFTWLYSKLLGLSSALNPKPYRANTFAFPLPLLCKIQAMRWFPKRAKLPPLPRMWGSYMWVVVKIMVPFWVPIAIRHLIFRVPKKGP